MTRKVSSVFTYKFSFLYFLIWGWIRIGVGLGFRFYPHSVLFIYLSLLVSNFFLINSLSLILIIQTTQFNCLLPLRLSCDLLSFPQFLYTYLIFELSSYKFLCLTSYHSPFFHFFQCYDMPCIPWNWTNFVFSLLKRISVSKRPTSSTNCPQIVLVSYN